MELNEFFPFTPSETVTADQWNFIFGMIRDGSFFLSDAGIGSEIESLSDRVTGIETQMGYLNELQRRQHNRQQIVLSANQTQMNLTYPPILDSETVYLNGVFFSKSGVPDPGFIGDYSIDGAVITVHPSWSAIIKDGDIMVIVYQFEVA